MPPGRSRTSAWAPKYLPESLLHFMRTRGRNRVLFASDYPVLSFQRTLSEANALEPPQAAASRARRRALSSSARS